MRHKYADDTQLYISTPNELNDTVDILSQSVAFVRIWMGNNKLELNPGRTE